MSQNAWIGIVVAVFIIGGGAWWFTSQPVQAPVVDNSTTLTGDTTSPATPTDTQVGADVNTAPISATVIYNGDSFAPSSITIKKGGTVKWLNKSGGSMWVASAQHPTHMTYSGTSRLEHCPDTSNSTFDQCAGGGDYSFTFDKVGTWNYHDHINATLFWKIIVVD